MLISICQINSIINDLVSNTQKIQNQIRIHSQSHILIFPELTLCGYLPYDFLLYKKITSQYKKYIKIIQKSLQKHQTAIIGCITGDTYPNLQNSLILVDPINITNIYNKQALPEYDIFFEKRYFNSSNTKNSNANLHLHTVQVYNNDLKKHQSITLAFFICYDLWATKENNLIEDLQKHIIKNKKEIDLIVWSSASPYTKTKHTKRIQIAKNTTTMLKTPLVMANLVGANDEIVFDGNSFIMNKDSKIIQTLACAEEDSISFSVNNKELTCISQKTQIPTNTKPYTYPYLSYKTIKDIISILQLGLRDYIRKIGISKPKVHLGISGGIDSALTLAIATQALGADAVTGILLPSKFTSKESYDDAYQLLHNFGVSQKLISIEEIFSTTNNVFSKQFPNIEPGITQENMQARIRGLLLMAYSNAHSSLLLTTGNKSEVAVGYCTLYGDMCGALNLIGDLYKTEVFDVCECINDIARKELIPHSIITKEPSAELRENQKDSDSLPDYQTLDAILKEFIENKKTPQQLLKSKFPSDVIFHIWNLLLSAEHKRYQAAPIIKISDCAFGRGRIMPIATQVTGLKQ